MGIMDKLGGGDPITGMAMSLLNQFGGVSGLMRKFQQSGHGQIAQSWVGDGRKLPIEPEQLRSTLGNDTIDRMSQQSGMQSNQVLQHLTRFLPGIIGKLTPGGNIPSGNVTEDQLKQGGIGDMMGGFMDRKAG